MVLDLRIRRVEQVIFGDADPTFSGDQFDYLAFGGRLRYQRTIPVASLGPKCDGLLDVCELTAAIRATYARTMETPGYIASGIFELSDFCLFGACGLPIDLPTATCLIGSAFDWEPDFTSFYLSSSVAAGQCRALALDDDQAGFSITLNDDLINDVFEPCVILSHPGQTIYGHWILDFLPRLHLLAMAKRHEGLDVYLGHLPSWANDFLEAFGFSGSKVHSPPPGLTRFHGALMPSSTKSGYRLGQPLMRDAWQHMKHFAEANADRADAKRLEDFSNCDKIFISRRHWHDPRRQICNIDEVAKLAVSNGYTVLHPEQFSLFEQATIFRRARAIIGEDGSALHNIIFSEPGCILGIIGIPERLNLWHLGICEALGHKSGYLQANTDRAGNCAADIPAFCEMLSIIEAHLT